MRKSLDFDALTLASSHYDQIKTASEVVQYTGAKWQASYLVTLSRLKERVFIFLAVRYKYVWKLTIVVFEVLFPLANN